MLLKDTSLNIRGEQDPTMSVSLVFERKQEIVKNAKGEDIPVSSPIDGVLTSLKQNYYYLLLGGSIAIQKKEDPTVTISCDYQSSSFIDYKDIWAPWVGEKISISMLEGAKLLSFAVNDDASPLASSVQALTITNTTINLNVVDNSYVIVIGKHESNGQLSEEEDLYHYKIGGTDPKKHINPKKPIYEQLEPGTLAIKANGTCHIIYIRK